MRSTGQHQVRDDLRGERRQEDATAIVAGGVDQALEAARRADDREPVSRRRPQPDATRDEGRVRQRRHELGGGSQQAGDARRQ